MHLNCTGLGVGGCCRLQGAREKKQNIVHENHLREHQESMGSNTLRGVRPSEKTATPQV